MNFEKVFRGYNPEEVDKYIEDLQKKESSLRATQKERIDELADENYSLRKQVEQYKVDEQAISKSLVASQKLAQELKLDAEKFSDLTLSRAKIFYATWNAYAQTLVATLSDEEVRQFNELKQKVEKIINAYDGGDVQSFANGVLREMQPQKKAEPAYSVAQVRTETYQPYRPVEQRPYSEPQKPLDVPQPALRREREEGIVPEYSQESPAAMPSDKTMRVFSNPIEKVQRASDHVIDLRELVRPTESLEDLCKDLGMNVNMQGKKV